MRARVLWACLFLATPLHARQAAPDAPSGELRVKTEYSTRGAESALGNVYRGDYKAAMSLVADEDYTRAEADLQRISAACDPFARPGLRLVAVNDSIEYERYVRENPGMPVEWLDMVCPWTLKSIAFVRMEAGDARGGAGRTRQGTGLAPYWADPHVERGYILTHSGRPEDGLASYREAIRLAEQSGKDTAVLAMGWRGVGYAQGELHAWAEARAAYRRSLEMRPGNRVALNELIWIDQQDPGAASPASLSSPGD